MLQRSRTTIPDCAPCPPWCVNNRVSHAIHAGKTFYVGAGAEVDTEGAPFEFVFSTMVSQDAAGGRPIVFFMADSDEVIGLSVAEVAELAINLNRQIAEIAGAQA